MSISQTVFDRKPRAALITITVSPRSFPEGTRYAVARRYGPATIIYDKQDYATEFAAYLAAAAVAMQYGTQLDAPAQIKSRLVAYWYRRGRRFFCADQPRTLCANKYERQGYDIAETEFLNNPAFSAYEDEKLAKPGLTDCVAMNVKPGEYGKRKGAKVAA
jgi:hypothetical protein